MTSVVVMACTGINANGDRSDGDYVDDKRHGHGVYYYADGSHYECEWLEGVEVTALRGVTHSSKHHQTSSDSSGNICSIS